jgi:gamma-glutamylcyclotransferase (GGCT)/AIG2-like uncharacterized protein YtfP
MFAYGSNMGSRGLAGKGVTARSSCAARLGDHDLAFDLPSVFRRVEGGVANVVPRSGHAVHGVLHDIAEEHLALLDGLEGIGTLYDRRTVPVVTYDGRALEAQIYVGVDGLRDRTLLPSARYVRILVRGAEEQALEPAWIDRLRSQPLHEPQPRGPFPPLPTEVVLDAAELARHPSYVALHGVVFDLTTAKAQHVLITRLLGGRDLTPTVLAMAGPGYGSDEAGRADQLAQLDELLHDLATDYPVVGRFVT